MDNRIITTDVMEEDFSLEGNLRPQTLDEYIGQEKSQKYLKRYILKLPKSASRFPGPCPFLWPSGDLEKIYPFRYYCQ